VPLGELFAAKARAWSVVVGGAAAFAFVPLALVMPSAGAGRIGSVVVAGLLVVGGAVSMTFLAIAMAAGGADLSDEQTTAVGPVTIYAFLLVGGLYNLVLTGDPRTRLSGLALYLFVTGAYWGAGVARAEICLDAEAVRTPRLRAADAATLLLIYALGARGLATAARSALGAAVDGLRLGWAVLLGLVALALLRRAPPQRDRRGLVDSALGAALLGAATGAFQRGAAPAFVGATLPGWIGAALFLVAEEIIFRGVLQRSLELELAQPGQSPPPGRARTPGRDPPGRDPWKARVAAALLTAALGIVALAMTTGLSTRLAQLMISLQIVATLVRGVTGRVSASVLARLTGLAVCTFL
jgi:hypothetical protein